jgi:3-oxoacyl-ACP reductase-like protein
MPVGRNMHSIIKQILTLNDLSMKIQDRFRLDGKVAIITGASKGIGKAIAYALRQQGAQVVFPAENRMR